MRLLHSRGLRVQREVDSALALAAQLAIDIVLDLWL